ncbi:hypothetical protein LR48_Vigan02g165900 [Vigna angularis]|uniref:Uncharacterized protein n=1 Tax=Phaseolus angularis TaxID=3914 RepID=A0A0L9TZC7_PHAAN|nr:hypothetical protein LR48_Vigan02g165900 [Vigna angularis]
MVDSRHKMKTRRRTRGSSSAQPRAPRSAIDKWLSNTEKHREFVHFWKHKKLIASKYVTLGWYRFYGFQFPNLMEDQGLKHFVEQKGVVYPDLVCVSYFNLRLRDGMATTKVKGVNIIIDDDI